jgi:hypothetical protein
MHEEMRIYETIESLESIKLGKLWLQQMFAPDCEIYRPPPESAPSGSTKIVDDPSHQRTRRERLCLTADWQQQRT